MRLQPLEARTPRELDSAFAAMTTEAAGAVVVLVDVMFIDQRTRIAELAATRRLPAVYVPDGHSKCAPPKGGAATSRPRCKQPVEGAGHHPTSNVGGHRTPLATAQPDSYSRLLPLIASDINVTVRRSIARLTCVDRSSTDKTGE